MAYFARAEKNLAFEFGGVTVGGSPVEASSTLPLGRLRTPAGASFPKAGFRDFPPLLGGASLPVSPGLLLRPPRRWRNRSATALELPKPQRSAEAAG